MRKHWQTVYPSDDLEELADYYDRNMVLTLVSIWIPWIAGSAKFAINWWMNREFDFEMYEQAKYLVRKRVNADSNPHCRCEKFVRVTSELSRDLPNLISRVTWLCGPLASRNILYDSFLNNKLVAMCPCHRSRINSFLLQRTVHHHFDHTLSRHGSEFSYLQKMAQRFV